MKLNPAMSVYAVCGLPLAHFGGHGRTRNLRATKSGPGRLHANGDGTRTTKQKRAGAYGRGLRNWINNQNRAVQANRLGKRMLPKSSPMPR
jgi:hypothetical protein